MKRIIILMLLIMLPFVSAEMTLKKEVQPKYNEGDSINIKYFIENKFDTDVTVTITDKNLIDNKGYEIECIQLPIKAKTSGLLDLTQNKIDAEFYGFTAGNYTLEPATMIYQHPTLGIVDEIQTQPISIEIIPTGNSINQEEIKKINLCNQEQQQQQQQQEEEQENQPSKEEAEKQKQEQQQQQQQQQKEMQEQYQQQSQMEKKLEQTQQNMNQDTSSTKKALNAAKERQQQQNEQLQKKLNQNEQLQEEIKQMEEQGYELKNQSISAKTNESGDFNYEFQNKTSGETENIQGSLNKENLEMSNTKSIKESQEYQQLKEQLKEQGFTQGQKPQVNGDRLNSEFINPQTGEAAKVTGEINTGENGNSEPKNLQAEHSSMQSLQKIFNNEHEYNQKLRKTTEEHYNKTIPLDKFKITQKPGEDPHIQNAEVMKNPVSFNSTTGQLLEDPEADYKSWIIAILAVIGIFLLFKNKKKAKNQVISTKKVAPFNLIEESLKYLNQSKKLFENKKYKDAYEKASYALRFYTSHKNDIKTELTNYETIKFLRQHKKNYKEIEDCLNLCQMVEFAKYKPNKKDFTKIINIARTIIR